MNCTLDSYHNCIISVKKPCRCKRIIMLMQKWFHHIVPPYSLHLKMYVAVSIKRPFPDLFWLQNGHSSWSYFEMGALLQTLNVFLNMYSIRFLLSKITLQKDCLNPMEQARNLHSTVSSFMNCGDLEKISWRYCQI